MNGDGSALIDITKHLRLTVGDEKTFSSVCARALLK